MDRLIAAIARIQERKRLEQAQQDRGQALQQFFANLKGNLSSYSIPGTPDSSVDVPVERPRFGASPEGDVTKRTIPGTPDQQVQYLSLPGFLSGLSGMDPKLAGAVDASLIGFGNYADAARGSATLGEMLERNAATQREQAAGRDVSAAIGDTSVRGAPVLQALARIDPKGAAALLSGYDANGLNREQFGFEKDVKFPWSQRVDARQLAQGDARLALERRGQDLAALRRGSGGSGGPGGSGGVDPLLKMQREERLRQLQRQNDPYYISQGEFNNTLGKLYNSKVWQNADPEEKFTIVSRIAKGAVSRGFYGQKFDDGLAVRAYNSMLEDALSAEGIPLSPDKNGMLTYKKPKGNVQAFFDVLTGRSEREKRDAIYERIVGK